MKIPVERYFDKILHAVTKNSYSIFIKDAAYSKRGFMFIDFEGEHISYRRTRKTKKVIDKMIKYRHFTIQP